MIMLLLLAACFLISAAANIGEIESNQSANNSLNQYHEIYISPVSKEEYEIHKDPVNKTVKFIDRNGTTYDGIEEILSSEIRRTSLSSITMKLDEGLRNTLQSAEADSLVPIIITFVEQPASNISLEVQAKYEQRFEDIQAPARGIFQKIAQMNGTEGASSNLSASENDLLTEDEKIILNQTNAILDQEMDLMRKEILEKSATLVDEIQAPVIEKIEANGGNVRYSYKIYNSISALVPVGYLLELSNDTFIAMIATDQINEVLLNIAVPAIYASTWWTNGYDGGTWDAAVVDTGIDDSHPDLVVDAARTFHETAQYAPDYNDNKDSTDDLVGHGTHCAGIIASTNSVYKGTAYGLDYLINAKAGYRNTTGDGRLTDSDIMAAVDWAVQSAGADVVSCSFGGNAGANGDTTLCHFMDAVVFYLNTPVCVAAGNKGPASSTVDSPGSGYNVITVGNIDDRNTVTRTDDAIASDSSRGPTGDGRRKPDISAPGSDIISCNANWEGTANDFIRGWGTSMATPMVVGSVLLLKDYGITNDKAIKAILLNTAEDRGDAGPDNVYGYGYIDLSHAYSLRSNYFTGSVGASPVFFKGSIVSGDTATLVWNRHINYIGPSEPSSYLGLSDLDLDIWDETTNILAGQSTSGLNNVEKAKSGSSYSSGILKVYPFSLAAGLSSESYALATEEGFSQVSAPTLSASLSVPSGTIGSGTTFSVSTIVSNTGIGAHNVAVTLTLPSGFSIVSGSNPQSLGTISSGGSKTATWTVQAPSVGSTQSYTISTSVSSSSYGETYAASNSKTVTVGPSQTKKIGVVRNKIWYLDYNGNGYWDSGDATRWFGEIGDIPIAGDWNADGRDEIGVVRNRIWYLDYNGNGYWDSGDATYWFGEIGDKPVVGYWG